MSSHHPRYTHVNPSKIDVSRKGDSRCVSGSSTDLVQSQIIGGLIWTLGIRTDWDTKFNKKGPQKSVRYVHSTASICTPLTLDWGVFGQYICPSGIKRIITFWYFYWHIRLWDVSLELASLINVNKTLEICKNSFVICKRMTTNIYVPLYFLIVLIINK